MRRVLRALGLACLVFVGCGGAEEPDRPSPTPARMLEKAADRTLGMGGAEVEKRVEAGSTGRVVARGRVRFELEEAHVLETAFANGERVPVEVIYFHGVSYNRQPGQKRWVMSGGRFGVGDTIFYLPAVATRLRKAGEERVSGVETTRIDGIYDLHRYVQEQPANERGFYRRFVARLEEDRMPMSVWLDDRGRIRQLRLRGDLHWFLGFGGRDPGSQLIRLKRFDDQIRIEAPPPRLVDERPKGRPEA